MRGLLKIITNRPYLGQKLRLELSEDFDTIEILESADGAADAWIFDCRTDTLPPRGDNVFYLTEAPSPDLPKARCLPLPLPLGLAKSMLEQRSTPAPLLLSADTRSVRLFGKHFQLTELEFSLLQALATARGEFLTREALLRAVWGEEGTNSLLSVYIHYLREKLERDGEKIILSSRGGGYALTKKLWEGEDEC